MKVSELLDEINRCKREYGDEFLSWRIYTEQINEDDKKAKKGEQRWAWIADSEDWEYFDCGGFWTKFPQEKIFTINVNY